MLLGNKPVTNCFTSVTVPNKILIFQTTWEENWNICCSLGMKPIMVETVEHAQCLSNWTKGSLKDLNTN